MPKPSAQNQEPTVQPNRNAIVDTIYRTAELGETTTRATEHSDSYRQQSRPHQAHQRMPHMQAAKKTMSTLIDTLVGMKDAKIAEIAQLGRTMNKRCKDILVYLDHNILRCLIHAANIRHTINAL
ncbi:hypothetical protein L2117_04785 [Corynebacterium diphtheriae bv. mitis]|uniref:hypothetical protein n=1 Tax=Corynebacterium diphtheriae TaxID=1717 RepID=UPI00202BB783|nr:hypothetical protein [Corynebacterium diphtheriae]MCM0134945.1 hypothetical protein [Corynebacterium diphtheriae bv. mitis]